MAIIKISSLSLSVVSDCDEDEMNCGNGDCIKLVWKCDGEEDCSNGEDERECDVGKWKLFINTWTAKKMSTEKSGRLIMKFIFANIRFPSPRN